MKNKNKKRLGPMCCENIKLRDMSERKLNQPAMFLKNKSFTKGRYKIS